MIKTPEVETYFRNYQQTFFNLFVLMTTANYPDVMLPAYGSNRIYFLFFFIFLLGATILTANMIIANMFLIYNERIEKKVKRKLLQEKKFKEFYKDLTKDKFLDVLNINKENIMCQKASLVDRSLLNEPEFTSVISENNMRIIDYLNSRG